MYLRVNISVANKCVIYCIFGFVGYVATYGVYYKDITNYTIFVATAGWFLCGIAGLALSVTDKVRFNIFHLAAVWLISYSMIMAGLDIRGSI